MVVGSNRSIGKWGLLPEIWWHCKQWSQIWGVMSICNASLDPFFLTCAVLSDELSLLCHCLAGGMVRCVFWLLPIGCRERWWLCPKTLVPNPTSAYRESQRLRSTHCKYPAHCSHHMVLCYICHSCGLEGWYYLVYFHACQSRIQLGYASGHYGDSVHYGDEHYFYFIGGHTLTSPKGGRPCPLVTFNYGVVGHLAFQLT